MTKYGSYLQVRRVCSSCLGGCGVRLHLPPTRQALCLIARPPPRAGHRPGCAAGVARQVHKLQGAEKGAQGSQGVPPAAAGAPPPPPRPPPPPAAAAGGAAARGATAAAGCGAGAAAAAGGGARGGGCRRGCQPGRRRGRLFRAAEGGAAASQPVRGGLWSVSTADVDSVWGLPRCFPMPSCAAAFVHGCSPSPLPPPFGRSCFVGTAQTVVGSFQRIECRRRMAWCFPALLAAGPARYAELAERAYWCRKYARANSVSLPLPAAVLLLLLLLWAS